MASVVIKEQIKRRNPKVPQSLIYEVLGRRPLWKHYLLTTNEVGLLMPTGKTAIDVALFDRAAITELHGKYFAIPPKVAIEFDIKVDVADYAAGVQDYMWDKTEKLLTFGVERVIWFSSVSRKVLVAGPDKPWLTHNWTEPVPVVDDIVLNLAGVLQEEGIEF